MYKRQGLYVPLTGQSGPTGPVSQDGYESAFFDDLQYDEPIQNSYAQSNAPPPGYYGDDAEQAFFFQEDPEDEIYAIAENSAPVFGSGPAIQQEPFEEMTDGYEDPDIDTFEWSGPIQPNAPPLARPFYGDDAEHFVDDPSDPIPLSSDYQQANAPVSPTALPPDDAYDWWEDDGDLDFSTSHFGNIDAQQPIPDDGWDWADQGDYDDEEWLFRDTDAVPVTVVASPKPPEDDPQLFVDDTDDNWETAPDLMTGALPNAPQPLPEDDPQLFVDETVDEWEQWSGLTDPVGPNKPLNPLLCAEDAWPHDDEAEDTWEQQPELAHRRVKAGP